MKSPVFILGCPRSGTTLLYHMLLSSGGFAVYRSETHVFNMIVPRFGDLKRLTMRHKLMEKWLQSRFFKRSGLDAGDIKAKVLRECKNGGDFLKVFMESIAQSQNVDRWAECTPAHALHICDIKKAFPDALFIHMIRDGRDVALSLDKTGWIVPFPWDRRYSLLVASLYWEWIINKGREHGRMVAPDYIEVHFEDLVKKPSETLAKLSTFIDHDLDFERIQRVGIGSVTKPNTSFKCDSQKSGFDPVGRWRHKLSKEEVVMFESLVGEFLKELGYQLITPGLQLHHSFKLKRMKTLYTSYYTSKQWLKANTPLSRFLANIDLLDQK